MKSSENASKQPPRPRPNGPGVRVATAMLLAGTLLLAEPARAVPASDALTWGACPEDAAVADTAECAVVEVPKSYDDASGETIELTVSRIPASGPADTHRGTLVGNLGGPGGSTLGMYSDSDDAKNYVTLPRQVRDTHDLVAVEPRGLSWGTPLRCEPYATDDVFEAALDAGKLLRDCDGQDPGYARTITTENSARDIEVVRQRLDLDTVSLYGLSYGGILMSTYATLFPQSVDKLVLDASASPRDTWFGWGASRLDDRRTTVNAIFEWIAERDAEYDLGATPLAVHRSWSEAVLAESGRVAQLAPPPSIERDLEQPTNGDIDAQLEALDRREWSNWRVASALSNDREHTSWESAVFDAVYSRGLYSESSWPAIAEQIVSALRESESDSGGDGSSRGVGDQPGSAAVAGTRADFARGSAVSADSADTRPRIPHTYRTVERAVVCNDNVLPGNSALAARTRQEIETGGDLLDINENAIASGLFCDGWSAAGEAIQVSGDGLRNEPLVLAHEKDSAVGADAGREVQDVMGGNLVLVPGYSHGVFVENDSQRAERELVNYLG